MKKIIAIALAVVMTMAMATTAFADGTVGQNGGKQDIDVSAKYESSEISKPTISVNVSWGAMQFTYSVTNEKKWDAGSHSYDNENSKEEWLADGNWVTVTNHSNVAIIAKFEFESGKSYSNIKGEFDKKTLSLPSAEGKSTTDTTLSGTTKLTLSGELSSSVSSSTNVGKITVNINKAA